MKNNSRYLSYGIVRLKINLKTKLTLILVFISLMNVKASEYSQSTHISLHLENVSVGKVLSEIMNVTDFKFLYVVNEVDTGRKVSISVENKRVEEILNIVFYETKIIYKINRKQIILSKKDNTKVLEGRRVKQEQQQIGNKVTGTVFDTNGISLPGVNIIVLGTTIGTQSDFDGHFSIEAKKGDVLEFTFMGMKTKDITLGDANNITVVMQEDAKALDEIVVVGYGTMEKKSLTAAVTGIDSKDIQTTTATSLAQKLSGKVAGLNIRQNDAEPGAYNNSINIRGFGEPIYVIDGIRRGGSADFQRLNSEDIESISILKDASAAIYGLNAANGVIIVTTKKGGNGETKFTYSTNVGFSRPTDVPTMANAAQYMELRNDANINIGLAPYLPQEELANWRKGGSGYESTDWSEETLRDHSIRQEHNISAQGGNDDMSYYINLGYVSDGGLLKSGDLNYSKYSFRSNLTANLTNSLTASINISGMFDTRNSPRDGIFNVWRGTVSSLPIRPVYANNNTEYLNRVQDGQAMTPVAIAQSDIAGYSINQAAVFQTSFELKYMVPFVEGLELKGVLGYDPRFSQGKVVGTDYNLYDYDPVNDEYIATAFNKPASINNSYNNANLVTIQAMASYKATIAENHNLGLLAVFERRQDRGRYASIDKYYDFFTNAQIDQAGETNAASSGYEVDIRNMSYIGRMNYNYKGKYLIEVIARYDGSYRYHPDVRWGLFPSVSAGWRISDENFVKDNISWLSNLKVRGSYGIVGQDAGEPFQYVPGFTTTGGGTYEFEEGKLTNGASTPMIVNDKLTWMESEIRDFGVDIGLFKGEISITADIYQRDRTGLLAKRNVSLPNTFGGELPEENLNSDRVRGFDFSINYNKKIGEVEFGAMFNYNMARTMNVYIESAPFTSSWSRYRSGSEDRWNDIIWTYELDGQFKNKEEIVNAPIQGGELGNSRELPGDFKYKDVNGDGVIDGNDVVPNSFNEVPKQNFGLSLNASWKGFDFSALFQGAKNFTVRYSLAYTTMFWGEGNLPEYFMDRWHKADPYDASSEWIGGEWPAMRTNQDSPPMLYAESSAWRRDASYVRFKNVELGYTLQEKIINKVGLENVRIYTNLNNIYTWADPFIKPFDPESAGGSHSAGWTYPIVMTLNFGLSANF